MTTTTVQRQLAPPPKQPTGSFTVQWGIVPLGLQLFSGSEEPGTIERHSYTANGHPIGTKNFDKVTDQIYDGEVRKLVDVDGVLVDLTDDEIEQVTAGLAVDRAAVQIEALIPLADVGQFETVKLYQVRPAPRTVGSKKVADPVSNKAFRLFIDCLTKRKVAALIKVAPKSAVRYGLIMPSGSMRMVLFDDEIRSPRELPDANYTKAELAMALELLDSFPTEVPALPDTAAEALRAYVSDKATRDPAKLDEAPAAAEPKPNLKAVEDNIIDLLSASVEKAQAKGRHPTGRKPAAKRTTKTKSA